MMPTSARLKGIDTPVLVPMTGVPEAPNTIHSPRAGEPLSVPPPVYPGESGWQDIQDELVDVVAQVKGGRWPKEFLASNNPSGSDGSMPRLLEGTGISESDPVTAAQYVAMDDPADLGVHLFKVLVKQHGVKFKTDYPFFPFAEEFTYIHELLNSRIRCAHEMGWRVKCFYGLERPETVLGLPPEIITTDKYGAPHHFSYVANHATGYGATEVVINERLDFTNNGDLFVETIDALWQGAMYRSLHGVHWRQDNEQGYLLGKTVDNKRMIEIQNVVSNMRAWIAEGNIKQAMSLSLMPGDVVCGEASEAAQ